MSLHESPQDLKSWIEYLKDRPLPIRSSMQKRLKAAIHDDRSTLNSISNLIKTDPVVCFHMVRVANQLHGEKGKQVTGMEHAVHSLGFDRIEKVVDGLEVIRLNANAVSQKMFFRSVANSHFASVQVKDWLSERNSLFCEESQLAALFYAVGHWMMWLYAPLHMSQIQEKIRVHGIDVVLAETDVLGCTLQEISHDLAMEWELTTLTIEALDHDTSPSRDIIDLMHRRTLRDPSIEEEELRLLNHMVQEKFFPVKLSNWVAITSSFGWYQKKTKQLCMIIGDYLGVETAEVMISLHRQCAESSQIFNVPGTLAPAAEMLMLPSDLHPNYKVSEKELRALLPEGPRPAALEQQKVRQKAAPSIMPEFKNETLFKKLAYAFSKGSTQIKMPTQVLQATVKALHEGLGMERVILHHIKNHNMISTLNYGVDDLHPLAQYQFNLEIPSLFKRLCDKPGCLWIDQKNRAQLMKALPECYQEHIPGEGAILMSIFFDGHPLAIIHADNGDSAKIIQESHNKRVRQLCAAAGQAMRHLKQL